MAYVTTQDVEERLGSSAYVELTDDAGTGQADLDKVNEAIGGAEGEVDSHLARRYAVPVQVAGHPAIAALLKTIVLDLVEYRLRGRRAPVPAPVERRRREAVEWLARVAEGEVVLPALEPLPETGALGLLGQAVGEPRQRTRRELESL